jgi:hypothetical protein
MVLALVAVKLAAHVATNICTPYEFHRDAFLYMAMGSHLRLLHMDFPPLMAVLSEAVGGVAGASLFAYRLVPALAGTAVLLLAILLTSPPFTAAVGRKTKGQRLSQCRIIGFIPCPSRTTMFIGGVLLGGAVTLLVMR